MIVGLIGKKQSGKDTIATLFQSIGDASTKSREVISDSLAWSLKMTISEMLGLDKSLLFGSNEDKETLTDYRWESLPMDIRIKNANLIILLRNKNIIQRIDYRDDLGPYSAVPREGRMTIRDILQVVGTDIYRSYFDSSVHTRTVLSRNKSIGEKSILIISDIRFFDEIDLLSSSGDAHFIGLTRSPLIDLHDSEKGFDYAELSRIYMDKFHLIDNANMTLQETIDEATRVWNSITGEI